MANRLYNKQVSPKGYMKGGRVKKMGGGMMMQRPMMEKGGKMRKKGAKGAPTAANFKRAKQTVRT